MQAVLLAAGESSRFFPFNKKHKCLAVVLGDPIIIHTIRSVKRAGISDIVLVTGDNDEFQKVLGNGKKFGVKIQYAIQKEAMGMGDAILCAAPLIKSDFFLLNSNHIEFDKLKKTIDEKRGTNMEVVLIGKENPGTQYGMLEVDGDRVISVKEKPESIDKLSNLRVVGVYFINQEFVQLLKKTKKGHYNFEDALDKFAKLSKVRVGVTEEEVLTLKYPWNLLSIKNYLLKNVTRNVSKKANISPNALIDGNVVIEEGATILEHATIKGPAYIGKNVFIGSYALVRDKSSIEEGSVVGGYMEVKNSLIMSSSKTHSGHLEDSIVGENSRIGALFTSANVRLDRKNVKAIVKNEEVDSGFRDLGVMMGSNTYLGARVLTMPGTIIGNNVNIGPSTTVMKNIESDIIYYTTFKEIVEKKKTAPVKPSKAKTA